MPSLRLLCLLLLGLFCTQLSIPGHAQEPALRKKLENTAGPNARDCGIVEPDQFDYRTSHCVMNAFKERRPFYVVYYVDGIDTILGRALAANHQGDVFEVSFDFGFPIIEEKPHEYIEMEKCPSPVVLVQSRTGRLRCEKGHFNYDSGFCVPVLRSVQLSPATFEGSFTADLVIHADGGTAVLEVHKSELPHEMQQKALQDLEKWHFDPATKDGTPVQVKYSVELSSDGKTEHISLPSPAGNHCLDSESRITR